MGRPRIDLTGHCFSKITIMKYVNSTKSGHSNWLCKCECGNEKVINSNDLKRGATHSCGCIVEKHGHCKNDELSREYHSWLAMKQRCNNSNNDSYKNYGGRGISVCDRWNDSFINFLADMGNRPAETSIDRIDVNGNYEPDNCRWATRKQQQNNRRDYRIKLAGWCNLTGRSPVILNDKISCGKSVVI